MNWLDHEIKTGLVPDDYCANLGKFFPNEESKLISLKVDGDEYDPTRKVASYFEKLTHNDFPYLWENYEYEDEKGYTHSAIRCQEGNFIAMLIFADNHSIIYKISSFGNDILVGQVVMLAEIIEIVVGMLEQVLSHNYGTKI